MTTIIVCDTCDYSMLEKTHNDKTGGEILAEHVERLAADTGLEVRRQSCLMGCERHCNVAIQGEGKLTYVLGKFDPNADSAEAVVEYAERHRESETGQVPFKQWPQGVKGHFVARIPSLTQEAKMAGKIPATVITGFLGAGKTTLVQHMLANANGKRIALIINEFGDLGIDGDLLKGCGIEGCEDDDVVELSNGCICCTVAEDFVPAIEKLLGRKNPPDHIVIETSGLALPQPLVRAFNWPEIRSKVTVDGVVTVVDSAAVSEGRFAANEAAIDVQRATDEMLDHETPLSELFEDQLACADMIVLNKADLLSSAQADEIETSLTAGVRSGVQFIRAEMGAVSPRTLLGMGIAAEADLSARHEVHHHHHHHDDDDADHDHHHHEHGHDEFESFQVTRDVVDDIGAFTELVAQTIRDNGILRLKGFAQVGDKPMRLVIQAVGPRVDTYFDRPLTAAEKGKTDLVVIGQAGLDRTAITQALQG